MAQFGSILQTSKTLTTTPAKFVTTQKSGREGYRVTVDPAAGGNVYVKEVTDGTTPTFADMVTNLKISWPVLAPGENMQSSAKDTVVVWGCTDTGTSITSFEELGS